MTNGQLSVHSNLKLAQIRKCFRVLLPSGQVPRPRGKQQTASGSICVLSDRSPVLLPAARARNGAGTEHAVTTETKPGKKTRTMKKYYLKRRRRTNH